VAAPVEACPEVPIGDLSEVVLSRPENIEETPPTR